MEEGFITTVTSFIKQTKNYPLLTAEQEKALAQKIATRNLVTNLSARNKLVLHNLRLIFWVAKRYRGRGLDLDDLLQEGVVGLIRAAEKYNYRRGRFATYAPFWIEQSIQRALFNKVLTIRLPVHLQRASKKVNKFKEEWELANGGLISLAEAVNLFGQKSYQGVIKKGLMPTTINHGIALEDGRCLSKEDWIDMYYSTPIPSPALVAQAKEERVLLLQQQETIRQIFLGFSDRTSKIAFWRSGLVGPKLTLREVGQRLDLSAERIRVIEKIIKRCLAARGHDWQKILSLNQQIERLQELAEVI